MVVPHIVKRIGGIKTVEVVGDVMLRHWYFLLFEGCRGWALE